MAHWIRFGHRGQTGFGVRAKHGIKVHAGDIAGGPAPTRARHKLRAVSGGENTLQYDLGSEDREGHQDSAMSVFTKDEKGVIRHFYTSHPRMAEDIKERGLDLLCPVYNFFDLTPQGRPNWYASLNYAPKVRAANP